MKDFEIVDLLPLHRQMTRHSVRLDQLIDLVSDRIRYYVQTCYELDDKDIQLRKDTRREAPRQ